MALSLSQTVALQGILKRGMRVAALGYPDIIAPIEDIPGLAYRADSEAICKRHGLALRQIPDAQSFFALLGCELDVYDIVQERGCEIICDLNKPEVEQPFYEYLDGAHGYVSYDIVLDVGTAEHCFNIGLALINMASLVKMGGYIIHENPANCLNHGFYSLNPTLFADFYAANGFKVIECRLATRDGRKYEVPHTRRFKFTAEEVNVFCIAQRIEVKSFVFPVQSKYAKLIPAAGVDRAKEVANG